MTRGVEGDGDGHMQLSLGLYVLGALDDEGLLSVQEHLAECAQCRAESAELSEVPAALALLSEEDVNALIREFGVSDTPVRRPPSRHRSGSAGGHTAAKQSRSTSSSPVAGAVANSSPSRPPSRGVSPAKAPAATRPTGGAAPTRRV